MTGNRFELIDGMLLVGYAQVARVAGDEPFVAREPFPVTIVPARLLDGLRPR